VKIVMLGPLPPARTGVAEYAAALLSALRRLGEVETDGAAAGLPLYHLANNQIHAGVYQDALKRPGVVVLHDAMLQHFFLGSLEKAAYVSEFVFNYGQWYAPLAEDLWRNRASSGMDQRYYRYPMLRRIAETAKAIVVHNPAAAALVRKHSASVPVVEVPHLFERGDPAHPDEIAIWKTSLGIAAGAFVFGVLGYLRESKRLIPVLRAFSRVRATCPDTVLVVAGQFVSSDLERAVSPFLRQDGVIRVSHTADSEFRVMTSAVDCCINLRYPAAGETSGIAVRMMGLGKPVIMTAGPEIAGYPGTACVRIDAGPGETEAIAEYMLLLAARRDISRGIGERAAGHIEAHHSIAKIASMYWDVLCAYSG
jgi:glycosyltransferase involved in cell wall biosynthesis